jgi:hypothetical protein
MHDSVCFFIESDVATREEVITFCAPANLAKRPPLLEWIALLKQVCQEGTLVMRLCRIPALRQTHFRPPNRDARLERHAQQAEGHHGVAEGFDDGHFISVMIQSSFNGWALSP